MKNVEDIYPLSPLQQGILFHSLYDSKFAMYFEIITWTIHGRLDIPAFGRAWQSAVEHHPILRTTFAWEGLDEPLQVVRRRVKLPLGYEDWRGLSPDEQRARLEEFFAAERGRGFNLSNAPLMRVHLIQTGDDAYRFVWCYHHSLVDGWSISLIFNDVFSAYEAFSRGRDVRLKPRRPFRDYIEWLRQQDLSRAEDFWRRELAGFAAPTTLGPGGGAHAPSFDTKSYREQQVTLAPETTDALQAISRGRRLTLNTICQGAWAVLLWRYGGERDVLFGVAVSGRPPALTEVETMVGMLVNTLPARVRVEPGEELLPWLQKIQERQVELRRYEYSPLVQIHGWSEVPRNVQLFESIVSFENHPIDHSLVNRNEGAELRDVVHHHTATGYPLNIIIEPGPALVVKLLYDFRRFDDDSVARLLAHYRTLLEGIAADPSRRLSALPLLTEAERRRILVGWNDTARTFTRGHLLHRLFEQQAERTPDDAALVYENERLTYAELDARANRLARLLRAKGVGPDSVVGLLAERSAEMVIGLLAILKAGGAYLPLDPEYPRERLSFMLADASARLLLAQENLSGSLVGHGADVVSLVAADAQPGEYPSERLTSGVTPDNLAYVIYTSGSTGRPKGVCVTHRAAANRLLWMQEQYELTASDTVLQKTPYTFDVSVWEFFWPLLAGARLVVAAPGLHRDAAGLARLMAAEGVTVLHFVPSMLQAFLAEPAAREGLGSARLVVSSGEALGRELVERFYAASGAELHNLYGPTEAAVDVSWWACEREGAAGRPVPIGRPISNVRLYVLDGGMEPAPVGAAGELYIGGVCLARGYAARPGLTAERFVPDPHSAEPGARLYKTGDAARFLPGGEIEYLGRLDHQVKVRGFRIELGEVEAALAEHEGVGKVVVAAREDGEGSRSLVAYVVPSARRGAPLRPRLKGDEAARLLDGRHHLRLPNGMVVAGHSSLQTTGIYHEIFEDDIYFKHGVRLEDGDCVFDVGANIGMFTLLVKNRWRNARVYAFEPLLPNFELLRANAELYGLDDVRLFECGLSDRPGRAVFTFYPHAAAMSGRGVHVEEDRAETKAVVRSWLSSMSAEGGQAAAPRYELDEFVRQFLESRQFDCQLRTLSDVIRETGLRRIDLLKLDVQKSELDVLRGIEEEDWPKIRQLVAEVHTAELLSEITPLLGRRGFTFAVEESTLVENAGQDVVRVYMLYARRAADEARAADAESAAAAHHEPAPHELRAYLRERLPEYMIPSAFVMLDELPLTPSGKVNRKALPAPEQADFETADAYSAPHTPVEEIVAGICAEVLGRERVGLRDNFFEIGGHSLLAGRVIARVGEAFGVELSLHNLFMTPTVAGLSQNVEAALRAGEGVTAPRIERAGRGRELPLSFGQQRLWFIEQLEPGNAAFHIPYAARLSGDLDLDALRRSFDEVARRHELLRTTFSAVEGRPVQVVRPPAPLPLPLLDLSDLAPAEQEARVREFVAKELRRPFDLAAGPLLRVTLLRLSDAEHVVVLLMHHIVSDGWSLDVLVREVAALYEAFGEGRPSPLEELPIQYVDFAAWQRAWLQGEVLAGQLDYWERHLGRPASAPEITPDRPRPALQTYRGANLPVGITDELSEALRALSRREGVTLFMTVLAALDVLLHYLTRRPGFAVVGANIAGRGARETEGLIGFFVNQLVLRTDLSGDPTFEEILRRVREVTLGAYAHQDVPFEKLVERLQPERDLSRTPLFQVKIDFQAGPPPAVESARLTISPVEIDPGITHFDLTLSLNDAGRGLAGVWQYNTDLFDGATVARVRELFLALLARVAADPEATLGAHTAALEEADARIREAMGREFRESRGEKLKSLGRRGAAVRLPE